MKAIVSVKALRIALKQAALVCRSSTIPILQTFRLTAGDGVLQITATDLDMEITAKIPASGIDVGTLCAPRIFYRLVKTLPNWDFLTLRQADDARVTLDFPDGRAALIFLPSTDFPELSPEGLTARSFQIDGAILRRVLSDLRPFVSDEETRYYLNGVHIHASAGQTHFVATNGRVVGRISRPAIDGVDLPDMILPTRAVNALIRLLAGARTSAEASPISVTCFVADGRCALIAFSTDNWCLKSKLIDAKFPNYSRVIPENGRIVAEINRSDWMAKISRLLVYSPNYLQRASMIRVLEDRISIQTSSPDDGEIILALKGAPKIDAESVTLSVSAALMADCLRPHVGSEPMLKFVDDGSPIVIESENITTVIMPMRSGMKAIELPEGCVA